MNVLRIETSVPYVHWSNATATQKCGHSINTFTELDLTPPKLSLTDAETELLDFAIVTWSVPPARLCEILPAGFEPETFVTDNGESVAFVSAVPFRDHRFHFRFAPFINVAMSQINLRAYVKFNGRRVVWFFGTLLTGFWNVIPHRVWKLPWYRARIDIQADWDESNYRLSATSELSAVDMELTLTAGTFSRLDGFRDQTHAALVLTHPLVGYYYRRDGKVGSYSVWHDRLDLQHAEWNGGSVELFEKLRLVEPDAKPHSCLVMPKTNFNIYLPPKVVPSTTH